MPTVKKLDEVIVHKVPNKEVLDYLKEQGLIEDDDLFVVEDTSLKPLTIVVGDTTVQYDGTTATTVTIPDGSQISY